MNTLDLKIGRSDGKLLNIMDFRLAENKIKNYASALSDLELATEAMDKIKTGCIHEFYYVDTTGTKHCCQCNTLFAKEESKHA